MRSRKTGNRPGLMIRREESRFFRQERLAGLFAAVLFLLMGGWSAGEINGDHFETLRARPVGEVLEPDLLTGPYYQVEDPVLHDGYTNVYRITSPFGSFARIAMPCSPACVANSRPSPTCTNAPRSA